MELRYDHKRKILGLIGNFDTEMVEALADADTTCWTEADCQDLLSAYNALEKHRQSLSLVASKLDLQIDYPKLKKNEN